MATNDGFWSYVRDDDRASFGKVVELGRDLASTYEMLTGSPVSLFLDRDSLEWGDAWQSVIQSNLGTVAFFIPIITPRYFQSAACRSELEAFAERTSSEDLEGLLLPILWVQNGDIASDPSEDPLVEIIKGRNWVDWTELRHEERGSSAYSRTIEQMAQRINRANEKADRADHLKTVLADGSLISEPAAELDPEDGNLEKLARMEEDVKLWLDDLTKVAEGLQEMGRVAQEGTDRLNSDPRATSFAGRLSIVRKIALELQDPASHIEDAGAEFARKVSSVDEGVRIIIDSATQEITANPEAREQFESFFDQLRGLDHVTTTVDAQLTGFIDSIAPLQKQSRDLKKPVQSATNGVTRIQTAIGIIHGWTSLIESLSVDTGIE